MIDGLTHEEIAAKLGISVGASKSNLFKAKLNLKKMLEPNHSVMYEWNEFWKLSCSWILAQLFSDYESLYEMDFPNYPL